MHHPGGCGMVSPEVKSPSKSRPLKKPDDRRRAVRRPCTLSVNWRRLGRDRDLASSPVKDISTSGLTLELAESIPVGGVLILHFDGAPGKLGEPVLLKVERVRELTGKKWLTACSFTTPFMEEDLQVLLKTVQAASGKDRTPGGRS